MRGTLGQLRLVVSLAGALTFLLGAQALAATNVAVNGAPFGSTLDINDATNGDDRINVSVAGNIITITQAGPNGLATADAADCTVIAANAQIDCLLQPVNPAPPADPFTPVNSVDLDLNNGTDNFANQNLLARVSENDSNATGNKTISSGPGDDSISTGTGNDTIETGDGFDQAFGGPGEDTITTGPDGDFAQGAQGTDTIDMGDGEDSIGEQGFANGPDVLNGGPGLGDDISYDSGGPSSGVTITLNDQADDGHAGEGDNVLGMEDISGTEGADVLAGNDADNNVFDGDGNDALSGLGGADELGAGDGEDTVDGGDGGDTVFAGSDGDGADILAGGPGSDEVDYCCGIEPVNMSLNGQPDDGRPGEGDNLSGMEGFEGGDGADTITADGASNVIDGNAGSDTLVGNGGGDEYFAGAGDDTLVSSGGSSIARGTALGRGLASRDDLQCDLGFDTVAADARDVVGGDCERRGAEVASDSALVNKKGKAKVRVACPAEEGSPCEGKLALLSNGKQVGKGKYTVVDGEEKNVTVKLSKKGKKALSKAKGSLLVNAEARTDEPPGVTASAERVLLTKKGGGKR